MNLLRKIELIHAVKCNKTNGSQQSEQSAQELSKFKKKLADEGTSPSLKNEIENWKNSIPIILDRDIDELTKLKSNN